MKPRLLVAALILSAFGAAGCNGARQDASSSSSASSASASTGSPAGSAPTVDAVKVVAKPLDAVTHLEGELSPYESVALRARANGYVARVLVDRGSQVKQGQLLLTLVAPELNAQRAEAQAKLLGDKSTYERLAAAAQTPGAVAGHEVEIAAATVQADQARVDSLRAMEQFLTVTAPFDGVITERNVHPGALVGPQAGANAPPMLRIEQVTPLRLTVAVPESLVGAIAEGSTATFTVRAYPGRTFTGVTKRISRSVDTRTRSMPVELDVDNRDGRLAPGMFADVSWPLKRTTPSLFVPPSAIVQSTERTFVARIKDGVVEQVPVQRGAAQGDLVEVFGALQEDDLVAKRGSEDLRNGTKVEVRAPSSPNSAR
jgi:RND family efflux transporter MFP subunit